MSANKRKAWRLIGGGFLSIFASIIPFTVVDSRSMHLPIEQPDPLSTALAWLALVLILGGSVAIILGGQKLWKLRSARQ